MAIWAVWAIRAVDHAEVVVNLWIATELLRLVDDQRIIQQDLVDGFVLVIGFSLAPRLGVVQLLLRHLLLRVLFDCAWDQPTALSWLRAFWGFACSKGNQANPRRTSLPILTSALDPEVHISVTTAPTTSAATAPTTSSRGSGTLELVWLAPFLLVPRLVIILGSCLLQMPDILRCLILPIRVLELSIGD